MILFIGATKTQNSKVTTTHDNLKVEPHTSGTRMLWYEEIEIDITEDGISEAKIVLSLIKENVNRHTDVTYFIEENGMVDKYRKSVPLVFSIH
jgi:ferric iron reductase protein FhuF